MSSYATPATDGGAPLPLKSADISALFRRPANWFSSGRVRKRLYAKGFPHPMDRGLWSAEAVRRWMDSAGSNPEKTAPRSGHRRPARKKRANGYAPVGAAGAPH